MPAEIDNPYPDVTPSELANAPGSLAQKAARNVAVAEFGGIPRRPLLLGENDHSPMMRGVTKFTGAVLEMLDAMDCHESDRLHDAKARVEAILNAPGIPGG